MSQLLLIDKDGTVTRTKSGETFVQTWNDQELIPGVAQSLHYHRRQGYTPIIITNQGGVAAGHKTLHEALAETQFACLLAGINRAYVCPDAAGTIGENVYEIRNGVDVDVDDWLVTHYTLDSLKTAKNLQITGLRKPECGMLLTAIALADYPVQGCFYVGDRPEDSEAAAKAEIRFMHADVFAAMGLQAQLSIPLNLAVDSLRYLQSAHFAAQQAFLAELAQTADPMEARLKLDGLGATIAQLAHILEGQT
jgi:D-glycero-D-manno-heptose 1,7-bisphosphate phosphatase